MKPRVISISQIYTRIIATTAPSRLCPPDVEGSLWVVRGISCPTGPDYKAAGTRPRTWRSPSTEGEIVLRVVDGCLPDGKPIADSGPCFQADTIALADAYHRYQQLADHHAVPKLATLWDYFDRRLRASDVTGVDVVAFTEALNVAAEAWGKYTSRVVGTMLTDIVVARGRTLIVERLVRGEPVIEPIDVELFLLEKRTLPAPVS